ncbi:hypothetical protein ACTXT7_015249 [Hymenolepis weldensis]
MNMPYIKWLSSSGGTKTDWIDAAYRGYIPAYSFLPNCQGVYHSGVDIPLLKSPSSGPCIVCENKASTRRHFSDISIESFLSNLQMGARYVVDLRAELIPFAYRLTTLRNVDKNEDLENWCLQASNDGKSWTMLKVHKNDRNLDSETSLFFKLEPSGLGFRLFRIMDLSPINNQGRMHVCGLDFYGVVKKFHRKPVELEVLAYIPDSIRLSTTSQVPTVAEFHMTNLMKSIRDNEFHVPCPGYSDSVYEVATGLKFVRSNAETYSERVPLVVPPISKDYRCLLKKLKSFISTKTFFVSAKAMEMHIITERAMGQRVADNILPNRFKIVMYRIATLLTKSNSGIEFGSRVLIPKATQIPVWRLQFELVVEQQNGQDLAEQLVLNKVSKNKLQDAKLFIYMKSISSKEKDHMKQEWLKKREDLISDGDWNLSKQQSEFLRSVPGNSSSKCVSKESSEDMLRLIQLLYQLSELRGNFGEADDRSCFISQHLTRKLERQFNDNIAVMTGPAFPNWCFSLTQKMNFLFPFELRHKLFKACAFGPARYTLVDARQYTSGDLDSHPYWLILVEMRRDRMQSSRKLGSRKLFSAQDGEISTDKTEIFRNLTGDDNGEEFWKWAERVLEENAKNMTKLTIRFGGLHKKKGKATLA